MNATVLIFCLNFLIMVVIGVIFSYNAGQTVLLKPNNKTTVLLIQNLYFPMEMVFKNTKLYFRR
jgi:hypothetical protein